MIRTRVNLSLRLRRLTEHPQESGTKPLLECRRGAEPLQTGESTGNVLRDACQQEGNRKIKSQYTDNIEFLFYFARVVLFGTTWMNYPYS